MGDELHKRRTEFERHLWNHSVDAFQMSFDARPAFGDDEVVLIRQLVEKIRVGEDEEGFKKFLRSEFKKEPTRILAVMQAVGLTRNKIITDLKASASESGIRIPGKPDLLPQRDEAWELAGPYLVKRLRTVLTPLVSASDTALTGAIEALNQATWPGWIRQERAKRSGHEAEHRVAALLASLELPFAPAEKADNPLCRDAQIGGVSFDIVMPSVRTPRVCVKATVHTSNIGQFGESKDALEVAEAREVLGSMNPRPLLLAMVDGVGFHSNRAGLDGVLSGSDEFCQFATIWKAAVLAAWACERRVELVLPDHAIHSDFLGRYDASVEVLEQTDGHQGWVEAGEATVRAVS